VMIGGFMRAGKADVDRLSARDHRKQRAMT